MVGAECPDLLQHGVRFPKVPHPTAAAQHASESRLLVVRMVVHEHQYERILLESCQDLRHIVIIPAVDPPHPLRRFWDEAAADFRLRIRVAVTCRPLDVPQPDQPVRSPSLLQFLQETFLLIHARKIGDQQARFHLSNIRQLS